MARIKNIELPGEKHTCIGLTAIYGIGRSLAKTICEDAGVDASKKIKDLTEDEVQKLRKEVIQSFNSYKSVEHYQRIW